MRTVFIALGWPEVDQIAIRNKCLRTNVYCLATLTLEDGALQNQLPHLEIYTKVPSTLVRVYVVENTYVANYDGAAMNAQLCKLNRVTSVEYYGPPKHCVPQGPVILTTKREGITDSPCTHWLRDYPGVIPTQDPARAHRPGQTSKILGMMGILPKGPETFFKTLGYSPQDRIHTETLQKITAILKKMAWELYLRRKKWGSH